MNNHFSKKTFSAISALTIISAIISALTIISAIIFLIVRYNVGKSVKKEVFVSEDCPKAEPCPDCPICPVCPEIKKKEIKKCSDFQDFSLAYWPNFLENECIDRNKCCNILKDDVGGFTCYGIAIGYNHKFYKYLKMIGFDVKKGNPKEIDSRPIEHYAKMEIYMNYYKGPKINKLSNPGLREVVFDNSVHAGPTRAIKLLQKLCKVKQDGHIGNKTITSCKKENVKVKDYISIRRKWLKTRKSWKENTNGFINRLDRQINQAKFAEKNSCYTKSSILPN